MWPFKTTQDKINKIDISLARAKAKLIKLEWANSQVSRNTYFEDIIRCAGNIAELETKKEQLKAKLQGEV